MFYDKEVEIWRNTGASRDADGIYHEGSLTKITAIMADVQPYSTERLKTDYGYEIDVNKRIFCDLTTINVNDVIKYNGLSLEVKKFVEWEDYMDIFCLEVM